MQWIAPSEKDTANQTLEKRLWEAADQLRATRPDFARYSDASSRPDLPPVRGGAVYKRRAQLEESTTSSRRGPSRIDDPGAYHAEGVYLTPTPVRSSAQLAGRRNVGQKINEAMADIRNARSCRRAARIPDFQQPPAELLKKFRNSETLEYDAFEGSMNTSLASSPEPRAKGRRVFHAEQHRPPDCPDSRTISWPRARPRVRLRRYVRAKRPLRARAPQKPIGGTRTSWPGAGRRHRSSVSHEPRRSRTGRRYTRGELVLRGPSQSIGSFDFFANPPFNVNAG